MFISSKEKFSDNFVFYIVIAVVILIFWVLDAWYLWMERLFRRLYDQIRLAYDAQVKDPYTMSFKCFIKEEQCVLRIMFSRSVWPVYLVPICMTFIMWVAFMIVCLLKNAIISGALCRI